MAPIIKRPVSKHEQRPGSPKCVKTIVRMDLVDVDGLNHSTLINPSIPPPSHGDPNRNLSRGCEEAGSLPQNPHFPQVANLWWPLTPTLCWKCEKGMENEKRRDKMSVLTRSPVLSPPHNPALSNVCMPHHATTHRTLVNSATGLCRWLWKNDPVCTGACTDRLGQTTWCTPV